MLVGLCYSSGACTILFHLNLHQFEGPYHIMPFICTSRGGHNAAITLFSIPFRFPLFDLFEVGLIHNGGLISIICKKKKGARGDVAKRK